MHLEMHTVVGPCRKIRTDRFGRRTKGWDDEMLEHWPVGVQRTSIIRPMITADKRNFITTWYHEECTQSFLEMAWSGMVS